MASHGEFYQTFREDLKFTLLFQKNRRGRNTPKFILQSHHHPDTKTRQRYHKKKNYRPISLMNIDEKSSTKCWQTESNNTLKVSYTIIKWDLSQNARILQYTQQVNIFFNICKSICGIHHINKLQNKIMFIFIYAEKAFYKIQHSFMI